MRECDAVADRALRGSLQPDIDRQLDGVPGLGTAAELERAARAAGGVHADLREARSSAKELVGHRLDTRLADLVARPVPLAGQRLELSGRHLADVAEQLRRDRLVRVVAQIGLDDLDAGEVDLVLLEVRDLVVAHGDLDGDGVDWVVLARVDVGGELVHRDIEDSREPADLGIAPVLRQVADPELDCRAGSVVDDHGPVAVENRAARRLDAD